jgi:SAM-dependent methyltransferase
MRTLSHDQARTFYDRFGSRQDSQAFYEDRATTLLVDHLELAAARNVFEFGCGTGRFAERLLTERMGPEATYLGVDVSTTMVTLARERLVKYGDRVEVRHSDGSPRFHVDPGSVDRVVSTFVLDLLSEADIRTFFDEAHAALASGGLLGLVSLTPAFTVLSRLLMLGWTGLHRLSPALVGGCRPIALRDFVDPARWAPRYDERIVAFGIPSEVVVVAKRS